MSFQSDGTTTTEVLSGLVGVSRPSSTTRLPNRTNLVIDHVELPWSSAGSHFGYVYFCAAGGPPLPVWEFAACPKSNLAQLVPEDFRTQFVSFSDRTNRSGIGPAVFGTNYLKGSIRVKQGQVVLARLARDHKKIYALEFARQTLTNAEVFYIEAPLTNPTTRPQQTPR